MEKRNTSEPVATPRTQRRPGAYHPPTLTVYGSVAKLTQGQAGSFTEGASGMLHSMPTGPDM